MSTPEQELAQTLLRQATPDVLLRTYASLTHIIDGTDTRATLYRQQRDEVAAEIERRMLPEITDVALNRAAQAFYEGADGAVRAMTDKPNIVNGLREALVSLGVPLLALPPTS